MNPDQIYQALSEKNLNATCIAKALSVRPQTVANLIREGKGSKRIAKAIAIALEESIDVVFPYYKSKDKKKLDTNQKIEELKERFAALV
ncbi:helix-turn-helix domain-containing protein [Neisseria sp. Ec49-e6-T10]|uniref:helix-turn-helix domain-containing protein n=1 Tax=Neisseria sp. Ec49-e6-T10 TaxID=3140744 RepID=UPI003EC1333D